MHEREFLPSLSLLAARGIAYSVSERDSHGLPVFGRWGYAKGTCWGACCLLGYRHRYFSRQDRDGKQEEAFLLLWIVVRVIGDRGQGSWRRRRKREKSQPEWAPSRLPPERRDASARAHVGLLFPSISIPPRLVVCPLWLFSDDAPGLVARVSAQGLHGVMPALP